MRIRFVISAVIFIVLCSAKLFFPENAAKVRSVVIPAITREAGLGEDCIAIGRAISGEMDYVNVWERLTGREKTKPSPPKTVPAKVQAQAAEGFPLSDMVFMNLRGYEALTGLPAQTSPPPENAEGTASASPFASSPSPSASPSPAPIAPVAPETQPVESAAPAFDPSAKIETFLQKQAVFSAYAVPANVSYDAPALPFEYSSPCESIVSSGFGYRSHPLEGEVKFHYGTDLGVIDGTDVKAFADGKVISVQELDGYGNTVLIQHADGYSTLYAHLSQTLVEQGSEVKRGDKIALSGHSGKVTGPHLHFELIYNGKYLNPEFYL